MRVVSSRFVRCSPAIVSITALIALSCSVPALAGDRPEDGGTPVRKAVDNPAVASARTLDPPLETVLTRAELELAGRLDDALVDLLHASFTAPADLRSVADHTLRGHTRFGSVFDVMHDKPVVDLTVVGDLDACLEDLRRATGVEVLATASTPSYHIISVLVPPASLLQAAGARGVVAAAATGSMHAAVPARGAEQTAVPRSPGRKSQGTADNQAEAELEVEAARRVFPTADGSGISVGTLSDSVNQFGGGISSSQASNDLPGNGSINVLSDYAGPTPTPTDEGRAMMEHIYDIAPSVTTLGFATAKGGVATFAANITALGNAGMDIINDDVVYYSEPYFQDGVVAQAVESYVNGGGLYFAPNGNYANLSWEGLFTDIDNDGFHEFAGTDETLQMTIAAGTALNPTTLRVGLQWTQPWGAAATDLGLVLYDQSLSNVLASTATNNVGGDPYDFLAYDNTTGAPITVKLVIKRISGSTAGLTLKFVTFDNGASRVTHDEYATGAGTLVPHAATPSSISIGAAPFFDRDTAEAFSGRGPHRRFFDSAGNPVGPFTLDKPDFLSIDRCNTTFFGFDTAQDPDALPNFSGTSAATPNAAAVAALMVEQAGGPGTLDQDDIREAFKVSAIDLGAAGHDVVYGHGRINALGAVMAATGPRPTEYTLYANQHGDVSFDQDLFGNVDIDRFEVGLKTSGPTVFEVVESHPDMDPMMVVFYQVLDSPVAVDYDGGSGDDVSLSLTFAAGIPHTIEIASEADFTGPADYTLHVNGPDQAVVDRTGALNGAGDDPGYSGSIIITGAPQYVGWDAPATGTVVVTLQNPAFDAQLLIWDEAGQLLDSRSVNAGQTGSSAAVATFNGEQVVAQVVSRSYDDTGSFTLAANFEASDSLIFADGFETGGTAGWSSAAGGL
jgi:hypothetical protein